MPSWKQFEDIEAWQVARALNKELWTLFSAGSFGRDYALVDQLNRAAGSTMDNVAEGFDGGSDAEFARFLGYTQRSCAEVRSQLYRALDRDHITQPQFDHLAAMAQEVHRKSGGLIKYLRSS